MVGQSKVRAALDSAEKKAVCVKFPIRLLMEGGLCRSLVQGPAEPATAFSPSDTTPQPLASQKGSTSGGYQSQLRHMRISMSSMSCVALA